MRFGTLVASVLFAAAALVRADDSTTDGDNVEMFAAPIPEVIATTSFPEDNPFNHIVNGENTELTVAIENKSPLNVTLVSIHGRLSHPETGAIIKNLTALNLGVPLFESLALRIPYRFYSEFKTGDVRLNIYLEHFTENGQYTVEAYDSIVTVVEPSFSIFDFKLLSTYATVLAILSGLGYIAYRQFMPAPKKSRSRKAPAASASDVSSPVSVTATGAGGYSEEWIPEHHLKKAKKSKKSEGAVTSGDDLSGAETSGAEGKAQKKKGRK
ncbi:hypothetical protein CVT24_000092 [Panaeolus cyanescens]|uniref:Translocon-associated protein subunit alpha n=1 Tax=Panaeolus cyanescens TaxID=181874 RepID=A0A409VS05_9AGAR|nr:hypothetical protein CVT24_000092 [Panaeolus cyanescens]